MKISIVTTLSNNAENLTEFLVKCRSAIAINGLELAEIIVVDDGSDSANFQSAHEICLQEPDMVLIQLTRNFGHHKALLHGLKSSTGELIFLIDSDLEEDPSLLGKFYEKLMDSNSDVVFGVQETRRGSLIERFSGNIFYWIMKSLMGVPIPKDFMTIRIMRRSYVDNLLSHNEFNVNLSGLLLITGHKQVELKCIKPRLRVSSYTLRRKLEVLLDAITSFSEVPLRAIFMIGVASFFIALCETLVLLISWILFLNPVQGWISIFLAIQLFGGLIMISLGIIGIYISRIFLEVKLRPRVLELSRTLRD